MVYPDHGFADINYLIMKIRSIIVTMATALLGCALAVHGQTTNTNEEAFKALITQVKADIQAGKTTDSALAGDLGKFDTLLAAEHGQPTELGARILFMKAMLYEQILHESDKAEPIYQRIKTDYPQTKMAAQIALQEESKKKLAALAVGATFPDFSENDVAGAPLSVGKYKGKVVLVDFWATWCGPCRGEIPNVVATYAKYHDQGFEIVGVSLDQDKDKLLSFTKDNNMTWPQYFDGQGWQNKLAVKYGIESIPATVLIDPQGKIIGRNLRGDALTSAVAQALGK
jgi:thiol-disulfide isomerase/thioredoxin